MGALFQSCFRKELGEQSHEVGLRDPLSFFPPFPVICCHLSAETTVEDDLVDLDEIYKTSIDEGGYLYDSRVREWAEKTGGK